MENKKEGKERGGLLPKIAKKVAQKSIGKCVFGGCINRKFQKD